MSEIKKKIQETLEVGGDVDVVIILDCTGSMEPYLEEAQKNIVKIIDSVKSTCSEKTNIRVAFVGYKDFGIKFEIDHFKIIDFTTDIELAKQKIMKCDTDCVFDEGSKYKNDFTEDVIGAIEQSLNLDH